MAKMDPKLKARKPKNVFKKPLTFEFKDLFKALSRGVIHSASGNWAEVGSDTVEALSALGLSTEPEELAYLLIRRSLTRALFELVGDSASQSAAESKANEESLVEHMDFSVSSGEMHIDRKFLDRPSELQLIKEVKQLLPQWLEGCGMSAPAAEAIAQRFPNYFVYSLNQEWRRNAKSYRPLADALDTPFARAGEREWAWVAYSSLLQRRIHEAIFDEPFSLSQIFVPLNAYFLEDLDRRGPATELARSARSRRRVVVSLKDELERWLDEAKPSDAIRVISGGPGSGKSSFARVFAAAVAKGSKMKTLYVPLHLIDPSKDLVEEVGRFVKDEGLLLQNPLDPDSPEPNLLIIFDGLDELASQGKAAAETARAFLREVDRTVEKRNSQGVRLRILIGGRELVVQENQSEFRRPRQILNLLPYFPAQPEDRELHLAREQEVYRDPAKLLKTDLRQLWWRKYGELTGRGFKGLPRELKIRDLDEITAQPLLNYLVALSFTRETLDFKRDVNLNLIYADLVAAVHERAYEKHRPYGPIRHMKLDDFSRVLEEIGLAAWHGDGRTTTVREIEDHCRASGLGRLLDAFEEGAKAGVTRLLAAFFFRQYGARSSGDPTFVFTHKSFGEYLAAVRVVRAMEKASVHLGRHAETPDDGWDEGQALLEWAKVCGPSAMSRYIRTFLLNEVRLRNAAQLKGWQGQFANLFSHMLQNGMPMEQLRLQRYREMSFQSRNAEEALLAALNACAMANKQVSFVDVSNQSAFGSWFKRIQGQRRGAESPLAADCLSFLDLSNTFLDMGDFFGSNLASSSLRNAEAYFVCFMGATLADADLRGAKLHSANFWRANLNHVDLRKAELRKAKLRSARLLGANLEGAHADGAEFQNADLTGAVLRGADLERCDLQEADLRGASLEGCNLRGANLQGANLGECNLRKADLRGARRRGANFEGANLKGVKLRGRRSKPAKPRKAAKQT